MKRKTKVGTVEFAGITYELTRADLQLIANALEIVSPDSYKAQKRAETLAILFGNLSEVN